ncbi:MAG: hypothetical protein JWN94_823 [Betaproteobacteria bacterium]|nr:hypothetical protein [Betaproteobacteria bacterium]
MNDSEYPAEPEVPPPGARLAAARESRGMTVAEIAQQLKLSPWQVEALEAGDDRRLPSPVFVRGFIRNYARLVKLDPAALLGDTRRFQQAVSVIAAVAPSRSAEIPYPTGRRIRWHLPALAAVVVLAALAIYEFYPDDVAESPVTSNQVEPTVMKVIAEAPAVPPQSTSEAPPLAVASELPAIERSGAKLKTSAASSGGTPSAGAQVVRLRFVRESWVEIRDRDGRRIFSQLNAPGTEQVVTGIAPLSLVVGNANGVRLTHNEQSVDLGPYTNVDVARLTLE